MTSHSAVEQHLRRRRVPSDFRPECVGAAALDYADTACHFGDLAHAAGSGVAASCSRRQRCFSAINRRTLRATRRSARIVVNHVVPHQLIAHDSVAPLQPPGHETAIRK
jgi:hypothetical protein